MTGVCLQQTPAIAELLKVSSKNDRLPESLELQTWVGKPVVPWDILRTLCTDLRELQPDHGGGPWLQDVAAGAALEFEAAPQRVKSAALQERLSKLQRDLDEKQYSEMVSDITVGERQARDAAQSNYGSYKQQISWGVHVLVMMGTLYAVGHVAGGALNPNPAYKAVGGLIGLIAALLLEATLLILRTGFAPDEDVPGLTNSSASTQQQLLPHAGQSTPPLGLDAAQLAPFESFLTKLLDEKVEIVSADGKQLPRRRGGFKANPLGSMVSTHNFGASADNSAHTGGGKKAE